MAVLNDENTRASLRQAWIDSLPETGDAHEEGGFILRAADGSLVVERWPTGLKKRIFVPEHASGKRSGLLIVATFHTHPNPNYPYRQEPSRSDILGVREDPELAHADYEGEFVIAKETVYLIKKSGDVETVGNTSNLLRI